MSSIILLLSAFHYFLFKGYIHGIPFRLMKFIGSSHIKNQSWLISSAIFQRCCNGAFSQNQESQKLYLLPQMQGLRVKFLKICFGSYDLVLVWTLLYFSLYYTVSYLWPKIFICLLSLKEYLVFPLRATSYICHSAGLKYMKI